MHIISSITTFFSNELKSSWYILFKINHCLNQAMLFANLQNLHFSFKGKCQVYNAVSSYHLNKHNKQVMNISCFHLITTCKGMFGILRTKRKVQLLNSCCRNGISEGVWNDLTMFKSVSLWLQTKMVFFFPHTDWKDKCIGFRYVWLVGQQNLSLLSCQ